MIVPLETVVNRDTKNLKTSNYRESIEWTRRRKLGATKDKLFIFGLVLKDHVARKQSSQSSRLIPYILAYKPSLEV